MKYFLFTLCLVLFSIALPVRAQFTAQLETSIDLSLSPANPGPNQTVSASLTSYATDLSSANITWSLNGKTYKSGIGVRAFSFSTGDAGSSIELGATIKTSEGETVEKNYIIKPVSVDLIWQSEGYVPPFYKGKSLFSYQNKIQFVALPHFPSGSREIPAQNLTYIWKKDGQVLGDNSGYGKNTLTMTGSIIARPMTIQVEVSSQDSPSVGTATTIIGPIGPELIFYAKSPLYGIQFNKALIGSADMGKSKEIELVAAPFYFGVNSPASSDLAYKWSLNGQIIDRNGPPNKVFRGEEGVYGTSNISLSIENASKILQAASRSLSVTFNKPEE